VQYFVFYPFRYVYKACSKKTEHLLQRLYSSFYSILSTVSFQVVPSTGDTPFPFLPLLECFLERPFYDGVQMSYCIFLNLLYGLVTMCFQGGLGLGNRKKSAGAKSRE